MVTDQDIRALVARIAAEFRPHQIILFGSHAGGRPGQDSDVDLLVVLPFAGPRFRTAARIRSRLTPGIPIDIVVRSPEELASESARRDLLLNEALTHGTELYRAAA